MNNKQAPTKHKSKITRSKRYRNYNDKKT